MNDDVWGILFVGFIIVVVLAALSPSPPKKKKEPTLEKRDQVAIELLRGTISPEALAERENISVEELNKWKDDFLADLEQYAANRRELLQRNSLLEKDSRWFESVCQKYIGSDWKNKTGYDKRNR